ncbi:UspA domain-containing protein [Vibrio nigripulchritudo ATCC 27043]|uniref:universal stress protein n=1 Tax=Vibrio nigripulchritudo TaxID=28173 RepID=UPI00021C1F9E|nr:universal stress protein [Vibrio nigripulchritudo]EGU56377.1 UspA domain-containing protein [Vibrio nigripulchritudo ATCC 27043]
MVQYTKNVEAMDMLTEVNTIIYASDMQKGSRPAFRNAVQQAIKHDAKIVFLHAIPPIGELTQQVMVSYLPKKANQKHTDQILAEAHNHIQARIQNFLDSELDNLSALKQPPDIESQIGEPHEVILSAAKQHNAQLIVMGDREANAISRLFLGSTALKVISQSDIPVLIVPLSQTQ